ncbi:hypothetical protein COBT_003008 [Conglomerata obtusa]
MQNYHINRTFFNNEQENEYINIINGNVDFRSYGKVFERFYKRNLAIIEEQIENTDAIEERQEENNKHTTSALNEVLQSFSNNDSRNNVSFIQNCHPNPNNDSLQISNYNTINNRHQSIHPEPELITRTRNNHIKRLQISNIFKARLDAIVNSYVETLYDGIEYSRMEAESSD